MSEAAPNISKATRLLRQFSAASVRGTADLAEPLGITTKSVSDTAAALVRRGYLVRNKPGEYQLSLHGREALDSNRVITSGPNGPLKSTRKHRNSFRARAWRAMRVRRVGHRLPVFHGDLSSALRKGRTQPVSPARLCPCA
ncbi:hypothetical protein IMCC21224_113492 [Puniceibacterium sp. IMCC21224]|nr:hypothetical protein IMCC21224_113492 [Puniceibacterium sp. IMCC21224]